MIEFWNYIGWFLQLRRVYEGEKSVFWRLMESYVGFYCCCDSKKIFLHKEIRIFEIVGVDLELKKEYLFLIMRIIDNKCFSGLDLEKFQICEKYVLV